MDFDSFVLMNLPGKRADKLRLAFKLIWTAHRIYPAKYNRMKGLRMAHYIHLKEDIEEKLSAERNQVVKLDIPKATIEKALRYMRKAGYMRYVPLEDLWYFSGKAAGTLRKLADKIDEYHRVPLDPDKLIYDIGYYLPDDSSDPDQMEDLEEFKDHNMKRPQPR